MSCVIEQASKVLRCSDPLEKAQLALLMRENWQKSGKPTVLAPLQFPPHKPGRPHKPDLVSPSELPRRRLGSTEGRGALLHAIAHIELNAIDLAADMIARFSNHDLIVKTQSKEHTQVSFITDWTQVCAEEAKHFKLLSDRLKSMGFSYGDFPAHNGLWDAADSTKNDIAARLAIAPMVLEARGLDVTPGMIDKLGRVGDKESVSILEIIYQEEVHHVRIGAQWFQRIAKSLSKEPVRFFHDLVDAHFKGRLKPPFNVQARTLAGLTEDYYLPLSNC